MSKLNERQVIFHSLHQQYLPMVKQLCLGYVRGDMQLAEDLTQEVFINTWHGLEKFRNDASYKTWIYRITVNTCLLYLRSSKKLHDTFELDDLHTEAPERVEQVEDHYQSLYKAIGALPHIERLIMMMILEELTYEEIGAITGINAIHLRVKIHRIKKKMRQLVKQD
ncbi:RNA polymerase sigma factor [Aridibaculum aurantiacum]|uniref:RNA polymerase sigma factor n=1 Tax=Aridibaculum aurantiacum TaxID=2810307 RepID=UPI001A96DEFE|nr:sigma-70 family RNA polymerase sigma factor [Aridibaculum aurantiacum]